MYATSLSVRARRGWFLFTDLLYTRGLNEGVEGAEVGAELESGGSDRKRGAGAGHVAEGAKGWPETLVHLRLTGETGEAQEKRKEKATRKGEIDRETLQ